MSEVMDVYKTTHKMHLKSLTLAKDKLSNTPKGVKRIHLLSYINYMEQRVNDSFASFYLRMKCL